MTAQGVAADSANTADPGAGIIALDASTARGSVATAVSTLIASALGALFALLVPIVVGEGIETDGFLAAYSAYTVFILFGASLRVALVPQFGPSSRTTAFARAARDCVGRIAPVAVVGGFVFALSAPLLGDLLMRNAGDAGREAAVVSIAPLGIASACQIWAASLASVLLGARRFVAVSAIYVGGSAVTVVIALSLMAAFGIAGAATGIALGSALLLTAEIVFMARHGFRAWPKFGRLIDSRTWRLTALMMAGSVLPMVLQFNLAVSLSELSGEAGFITGYTYAYLLVVTMASVTSLTVGTVTMPNLIDAIGKQSDAPVDAYLADTARFGTYLFVPLAAAYALFGFPLIDALFGSTLSDATIDVLWDASRIFLGLGMAWALLIPVSTVAIARRQYLRLATVAVSFVPVFVVALSLTKSVPTTVAAIQTGTGVAVMVAITIACLRGEAFRGLVAIARAVWPCIPLGALFVVTDAVLGTPDTVLDSLLAIGIAAGAYLIGAYAFWPSAGRRVFQLLRGAHDTGAHV